MGAFGVNPIGITRLCPYVVIADHDIVEIKTEWSEKRTKEEEDRNKKHANWNAEITKIAEADRLFSSSRTWRWN